MPKLTLRVVILCGSELCRNPIKLIAFAKKRYVVIVKESNKPTYSLPPSFSPNPFQLWIYSPSAGLDILNLQKVIPLCLLCYNEYKGMIRSNSYSMICSLNKSIQVVQVIKKIIYITVMWFLHPLHVQTCMTRTGSFIPHYLSRNIGPHTSLPPELFLVFLNGL